MKRLSTWCGIGLAAAVVAAGAVAALSMLLPPAAGSGITQANYNRLTEGMSEAEVEAILGCPAGDYTDGTALPLNEYNCLPGLGQREWVGLRGTVIASFRVDNRRLASAEFRETHPTAADGAPPRGLLAFPEKT